MPTSLSLFVIALPVFLALDLTWIGFAARGLYKSQIGYLMASNVNWLAAIAFYVVFIIGLVVFVIGPAYESHSWIRALMYGALFGLVTYATYDLTSLATTKDWPLLVTAVDLAWGTVLAASVSVATVLIANGLKV
ncbi:MAG: DUF2177 family protein [Patescibacteria group bacterium]